MVIEGSPCSPFDLIGSSHDIGDVDQYELRE